MTGSWVHWPRIFYVMGGVGLVVLTLMAVALHAARQQAATTAASQQSKPPDAMSDKPSAEMEAAIRRPLVLTQPPDVEQPRLPSMNGAPSTEMADLRTQLEALKRQQADDAAQRARDVEELKRLQAELAKKPKPVDPEAQKRAQEAKEAAKQRAEALKVRLNSSMSFFHEEKDEVEKGVGKRVYPPYKHFLASGSIINCTVENGINTDHQAPVIGRISGPVYDSVTGEEAESLQDAVLMGSYQSVLLGDETVTVTWEKLIYHDGSEADLGGQPGGNQLGRAGLPADIDNKWGTSILAMVTRSVQSASTVGVSLLGNSPAERVAAASAGQAVNQAGQTMQRTMNVSPTGYVEPGTPCSLTLKSPLDLTAVVRR